MEGSFSNPGYLSMDLIEEGRREIFKWSEKRQTKRSGLHGTLYKITKLFITRSLVRSFMYNLSIVVVFQMLLAAICTYSCVKLGLEMDVHMSLFVSPIVFPLAFSINANYQRRESVLEDLAMFKSSSSILFFCHRDWIKAASCLELPVDLLKTLSNKLKFLVINIREYLLTENSQKRKFILQAIYEDFSDIAQLNDKIRTSPLKSNSALVARIIHCHNLMCWSFEKLRVIREYSSPRSLRAFTKVFIFLMPLLLSPYYVFSGRQTQSTWTPYYISVMVSFLFGSLQAVQDKLDDPFDGIGEDDVNLEQLNDWTTQSLLTNRTVTIGRFTVTTTTTKDDQSANTSPVNANSLEQRLNEQGSPKKIRKMSMPETGSPKLRRILSRKSERRQDGRRSTVAAMDETEFTDQLEARCHGIASKLEGMTGTTVILPGNRVPYVFQEYQGLKSPEPSTTHLSIPEHSVRDINTLGKSTRSNERKGIGFRLDERLAVLRESDEEDSHTLGISPVSEKVLSNMKSDAVVKPDESSQKRPTVLGLFASTRPEEQGNTSTKVSDNVFTSLDKIDEVSPTTHEISPTTHEISPIIYEISPTTDSSEELPLLTANNASSTPESKPESGSSSERLKTSSGTSEEQLGDEKAPTSFHQKDQTTTRLEHGNSHSEPNSQTDGVPKLRFCVVSKREARGKSGGGRWWGKRKHRRKRPLVKGKLQFECDTELKATTSLSPLLSHDSPSESLGTNVQEGSLPLEQKSAGSPDRRSVEGDDLEPIETNYSNTKLESRITDGEEKDPHIVVNSPTEEESSLWDFDLSNIPVETKTEENVPDSPERTESFPSSSNESAVSDRTSSQNIPSSHGENRIWDIPSSENDSSAEPRGSRFTVSRNSNDIDSEKTNSKPRSRFTVSPS